MNLRFFNSVPEKQLEIKEGYRNFDLTEEERQLIENIVDAIWQEVASEGEELLDRGQRRKLQLYGDKGQRES